MLKFNFLGILAAGALGAACSAPVSNVDGMQTGSGGQQEEEDRCFDFGDMGTYEDKAFGAAPEWRRVSAGLNLLGKCQTEGCPAFNRHAYSQHGFESKHRGRAFQQFVFNVGKEISFANCPE